MSVMIAAVGTCIRLPVSTSERASAWAASRVFMNAPLPHFTSSTNASSPSASFLLMMLAVIKRNRRDGAGDVAERVKFAVCGHKVGRRAADHAADAASDGLHFVDREIGAEAGNRLELVERAAGRAEAAAGDHRHLQVAAGQERREDQRDFVADAAGGMLVDLRRFVCRPLKRRTGTEHVLGERGRFRHRHAAQIDGHCPGGHLVVVDVTLHVGVDDRADLEIGEFFAVAFFRDQVDDVHGAAEGSGFSFAA